MPSQIVTRITPDQIIERAEMQAQAFARWAICWLLIGSILGVGGTVLAMALFGRQ